MTWVKHGYQAALENLRRELSHLTISLDMKEEYPFIHSGYFYSASSSPLLPLNLHNYVSDILLLKFAFVENLVYLRHQRGNFFY